MEATKQERTNNLNEAINYNMLQTCKQKVKEGRTILIAIAVLNLLSMFWVSSNGITIDTIIGVVYVGLFTTLAILTSKIPHKAILIGLSVYLGTIALVALIDWTTLFSGVLIKLLIISGLIKAYVATKDVKELQQKLAEIEEA